MKVKSSQITGARILMRDDNVWLAPKAAAADRAGQWAAKYKTPILEIFLTGCFFAMLSAAITFGLAFVHHSDLIQSALISQQKQKPVEVNEGPYVIDLKQAFDLYEYLPAGSSPLEDSE